MALHNDLGRAGEDLAADFLKKKGYKILERNWRLGDLEIDIIAMDGDTLVMVEVKTRSDDSYHSPEYAVDYRRQRRMTIAMNAYKKYHNLDCDNRYDIIGIVLTSDRHDINHIEGAFRARYKQSFGYTKVRRHGW